MAKTFSTSDVASHNKPDNLYVIVDEDVYDLTKFQDEHPGMFLSKIKLSQADLAQVEKRVRDLHTQPLRSLTLSSPPASRRQGCLEAVLEIPQREHPEEIQVSAACRLSRHKEEDRTRSQASTCAGEEGHSIC
jgi:Cytochrome b5-like Heme/Steroid binding domain